MADVERDGDRPALWSAIWTTATFVAALLFGARSVGVIADLRGSGRSYSSGSTGAALATMFAGLAAIVAGCIHRWTQRSGALGVLAAALGVTWLAAEWIGWSDGPAWVRSVAMIVAPLSIPVVVHLLAVIPNGRIIRRLDRIFVTAAYGGAVVFSFALAAVRDPFRDRYCWRNCTENSLLVHSAPNTARALITVALGASSATTLVAGALAIGRLRVMPRRRRRQLLPLTVPAVAVAWASAGYAAALVADPDEGGANHSIFVGITVARAAALMAVAAGLMINAARVIRMRHSIGRLATELGEAPPPGSLKAALARSLGDDQLDVAYWSPERNAYLDQNGQTVQLQPGPSQTITPIARSGQRIAVVVHDRNLAATTDLEGAIGSASRLAVDNERLRAETLAQLADLRASLARIVDTSDGTRRRLERDLHDGAQQRLLVLLLELRLAHLDAKAVGNDHLSERLSVADELTMRALLELRDLAHGIYPAILSESGLGPALASFADVAPLRVELVDVPTARLTDEAEAVAYLTVTAASARAERRASTSLVATFGSGPGGLSIDIVDDGSGRADDELDHLRDRLGAIGATLDLDDSRVRAVIPCV